MYLCALGSYSISVCIPIAGGYSLYEQHESVKNSGSSLQTIRNKVKEIHTQLEAEKNKNSGYVVTNNFFRN